MSAGAKRPAARPSQRTSASLRRDPSSTLIRPTWVLHQTQYVPRPPETIFEFFSSAENLERLTPPFVGFHILSPRPIPMGEATRIAYQIRLWGLPVRWLTGIEAWDPPRGFADIQLRGPYQYWRHEHRFEATDDGGTLMTDEVRFRLHGGPLAILAYRLVVRRSLRQIFSFRARALAELMGETKGPMITLRR